MNDAIEGKIISLRRQLDEADMYLGLSATPAEINFLVDAARAELGEKLPAQYLDFLRNYDGLVASGVFIFSSGLRALEEKELIGNGFVENNIFQRCMNPMSGFLVFGQSDQDEYVLDLMCNKYQVRDRQSFDNVFEEFDTFDGILEFMVDLIVKRSFGSGIQ